MSNFIIKNILQSIKTGIITILISLLGIAMFEGIGFNLYIVLDYFKLIKIPASFEIIKSQIIVISFFLISISIILFILYLIISVYLDNKKHNKQIQKQEDSICKH